MKTFTSVALMLFMVAVGFAATEPGSIGAECTQSCDLESAGDFHKDSNNCTPGVDCWTIGTFHSSYIGYTCEYFEDHKDCEGFGFIYDESAGQLVLQDCSGNVIDRAVVAVAEEAPVTFLSD